MLPVLIIAQRSIGLIVCLTFFRVPPNSVYAVSFFWYGLLGFAITYIIGYLASYIFSKCLQDFVRVKTDKMRKYVLFVQ